MVLVHFPVFAFYKNAEYKNIIYWTDIKNDYNAPRMQYFEDLQDYCKRKIQTSQKITSYQALPLKKTIDWKLKTKNLFNSVYLLNFFKYTTRDANY